MLSAWRIVDALALAGFAVCLVSLGCEGGELTTIQRRDPNNGVWSKPQMIPVSELEEIKQKHGSGVHAWNEGDAWAWDCSFGHDWYYNQPTVWDSITVRSQYNLRGACIALACGDALNFPGTGPGVGSCLINLKDIYWMGGGAYYGDGTLNDSIQSHWSYGNMSVTFNSGDNGTNNGSGLFARYDLPVATPTQPGLPTNQWKECVPHVWDASSLIMNQWGTPAAGDKLSPPPGSGPCWSD